VDQSGHEANPELVVIKTNWQEIEDKIKPLLDRPLSSGNQTNVSNSSESPAAPLNLSLGPEPVPKPDVSRLEKQVAAKASNASTRDQEMLDSTSSLDETTSAETAQLKEENERLKNERLCVVCLDKVKNIIFLPCAHLAACLECSFSLQNCPMCRTKIQATVRTFT
jgi:hypothetical protein